MRKFKLIKEYPGSPKLGTILHECGIHFSTDGEDPFIAHRILVLEYTEYFEEVKDEYPKIISFRSEKVIYTLQEEEYRCSKYPNYEIFAMLDFVKNGKAEIYQVATSKTDVWTVGDKIKCKNSESHLHKTQEITGFFLNGLTPDDTRNICVKTNLTNKNGLNLKNIEKAPQPIFTTEDGIDKYYRDTYYYVIVHDRGVIPHAWEVLGHIVDWENPKKVPLGRVQFHNLDKALTWIEQNKPRFSVKDIEDLTRELKSQSFKYWDEIIKQKLGI